MRILVLSDTHGDFNTLRAIVERQREITDLFLHLGDGERDVRNLLSLYPDLPIRFVRGNCDQGTDTPFCEELQAQKVKLFMTHGHLLGVKYTLDRIEREAKHCGARVALYGHTHSQFYSYERGIHILNPGSPSFPRGTERGYGVVEIHGDQILCSLARL